MCEFFRISYRMYAVQQWLSHTGEAENSEVAQSTRVDVSAVPGRCWKSLDDFWRAAIFSLPRMPKEAMSKVGEGLLQRWGP